MDPTVSMAWGLFIFFAVYILLVTVGHPGTGRIHLHTNDFQRLVISETNIKIIWTKSWGTYYYFATVGGNQVYTTSEEPLEFPDSCELIPIKHQSRNREIAQPLSNHDDI